MSNPTMPRLFNKAVAYLESNNFEHADFSIYFPKGEGYGQCGGIGLSCHPDTVYIEAIDCSCANKSPNRITITDQSEHLLEPILDVLMFAVKLGEDET